MQSPAAIAPAPEATVAVAIRAPARTAAAKHIAPSALRSRVRTPDWGTRFAACLAPALRLRRRRCRCPIGGAAHAHARNDDAIETGAQEKGPGEEENARPRPGSKSAQRPPCRAHCT